MSNILLHPVTGDRMTPEEVYAFCMAAWRSDDETSLARLWVMRLMAKGEHQKAIERAYDDRVREVAKPAGAYLPGEATP